MKNILEVRDLQVAYGAIQAIKGIDLHIREGEMVALIGANGAGKTTTLKTLAGLLSPVAGQITFDGKAHAAIKSYDLIRQGLALVPEGRGIFPKLTVYENLEMGAFSRTDGKDAIQADIERMFGIFPRLKERAFQLAGTMSGGEQQMLAISRALMGRPKLLLLDEPSMGLAPIIVQKIFETIVEVVKGGVTLLLVEQNARLALQTCQRAYVIDGGRIALEGQASDLLHNEQVQKAYLGE
ncbi:MULTISPECIES: ABC transporter ATP-binding protein [Pseudomonas]|jgi:branched-chain amino acid transport system ATP-binding protein|uniref:ABC transporter ATP-binding protein n=1 Tax=Pseudomonas TaxID=286 RepID=UPI0005C18804|nr:MULTISPECIES: ABC transporter ATP-binding protein [Pseudomonas]KIU45129.1 ABC transporter ATP-binding protein [Pseudomonas putida]KTC25189.1 ABC transporter ATP-binding protein [Pseudomonas putida]MBG8561195.1 ABC transporter ATP-binding protein [Pseudomonas qingdaonensis]MCO7505507.1 ABC transporter ATP-binding protein [Pseudomonas sp. VE 267-6A]MCO7528384.1 ABC transporter ATP-binding protein [Pseudomonas sp. 2]